jgi:hypothetical protein
VREGEGVAAQVLVRLGASLNDVRQKVLELTAKAAESGPEAGLRVIREGDLAGRLDEILARLGAIESRLTRIDSRLARLEGRFGRGRPGDTGTAAEEPTGEGVSAELGGEVHGGEAPGTGTGRAEDTGDGETDDGDAAAVGGT